ncbi:hypothetical protein H8356DRAFT_1647861 [Neocallimastix lanati (nom. inval.)]|nr:hypothetical protein H8356DRAFT_1647861 [Neocallimastix sp. JGI-2020a]
MVKITEIPNIQLLLMRFKISLTYINIGLANKACISNNSAHNKDDTCIYDPIDTKINDKSDLDDPDTDNKEISDNNLNSSYFNKIKYTSFLNIFSIFIVFIIFQLHITFLEFSIFCQLS